MASLMGAPATHKSTKNMKLGALGEDPKQIWKTDSKLEAPDPRDLCSYTGGVAKITLSTQLQKPHQMPPKMSSKWSQKQSYPGPEASSKTQQKQTPKTTQF